MWNCERMCERLMGAMPQFEAQHQLLLFCVQNLGVVSWRRVCMLEKALWAWIRSPRKKNCMRAKEKEPLIYVRNLITLFPSLLHPPLTWNRFATSEIASDSGTQEHFKPPPLRSSPHPLSIFEPWFHQT